jgi:thiamine biosynthesis lipoprotein
MNAGDGGASDLESSVVTKAKFKHVAGLLVLLACAREGDKPAAQAQATASKGPAPAASTAGGGPSPTASAQVPFVRERRTIMSTVYEISVISEDEAAARAAIAQALDEVKRLEGVLSEWLPDSEVSRVNAAAGKSKVKIGPDLLANVRASLDAAVRTNGAFDITWAALREFYLFQPGQRRAPDLKALQAKKHLVNYRDVLLDEQESTLKLRREGMAIGLGGIAKGWAADRASAILLKAGFPNHMIFAGGQVLVHGMRGDRKWRVGIQHPRRQDYIGFVELTDASIATAGDYEHAFVDEEGRHWHHIIDLETGLPATRSASVTLIAKTGLLADALDTGCFIIGPQACLEMIKQHPEPLEAVIIDPELRVFVTDGMRDKLIMRMQLDETGRLPR